MPLKIQQSYAGSGSESDAKTGRLYLVGTPIGNLEDMTFRAIRILKEAEWIAAEDTRQTRKLLTHYEIPGRVVSYHEHNKAESGPELIRKLLQGETVALVSDAGLPAISDPGADLARAAIEAGIPVIPVPGANAALSALIISGLSTESFKFVGFLPRIKKKRAEVLEGLKTEPATLIFYESPHRLEKMVQHMLELWGDRQIALVRELTKKYEEVARGKLSEIIPWLKERPPLGEYCVLAQGYDGIAAETETEWWKPLTIESHVEHYTCQGLSRKEALKQTAIDRNVPKREVYNQLIKKDIPGESGKPAKPHRDIKEI